MSPASLSQAGCVLLWGVATSCWACGEGTPDETAAEPEASSSSPTSTPPTPTSSREPVAFEPCACLATALSETSATEPCTACQLATVGEGGSCDTVQAACEYDPACVAIATCVGGCESQEPAPACVGQCIYGQPDAEVRDRYLEFLECLCTNCPVVCDTYGEGRDQCILD